MISAIVLTPDDRLGVDADRAREVVARSLVWLVSAVVAGVVREVTLAASSDLGLADLADHSGCALIEAGSEGRRLSDAARSSHHPRLLVIRAGYHPDGGLIDEIAAFVRREPGGSFAALRAWPTTLFQRLLPRAAPIVGVLGPTAAAREAASFAALARQGRRGLALQTNARPIA